MKRVAGRNLAMTNTIILLFDLMMLCSCALLYQSGEIGFAGVLLPTLALMSSFRTGGSFGKPRQYLAKYLCSGKSCAGYFGGSCRL